MSSSKTGIPNVVRKGLKYWFQVKVPKDIVDTLGKSNWQTNLQTSDLRLAKERAKEAAVEARKAFAKARVLDPIEAEAVQWRDTAILPPDPDLKYILITDRAEELEQSHGCIEADRFANIALGQTFDAHFDLWCKEFPVTVRSERARKTAVNSFLAFAPGVTLGKVDRSLVGRFASHLLDTDLDPVTVNKRLQYVGSYYKFCLRKGFVKSADNPFTDQTVRGAGKAHRQEQLKRPWSDQEITQLFTYEHSDEVLKHFMRISALSGMRINEIAELSVKDCAKGFFKVTKGKTEAALRSVPIHSDLTELVQNLTKGKGASDYLFPELESKSDNPARERSMPVSKRFGRFHRKVLGDQRTGQRQSPVDFHSFRRWFSTKCEEAGQPEHIVAAVMGHRRPNMTFGLYSGGPSDDQKIVCVEAVSLPLCKKEPRC